jgi:cellulose synthase (UDP-forming)
VQRRRWANGGLLILPKLWAQTRERRHRGELVSRTEILLRLNYMASITWSSFSLIFLLAFPFDGQLLSPFVVLAALPYFISMASDLKYCGYKWSDVLRIYGFNLILLPVNLAGVLKSLQQALTSKKIPFARTPKVKNRTVAPLIYLLVPLLLVAFSAFTFWRDEQAHNWANAAFECFNALTASWAIVSYIGIGNALADIWRGLTDWLYVEVPPRTSTSAIDPKLALDWRAVLYHGNAEERVPLRALHAATGSYQSVSDEHNEQRLPDTGVSSLSTLSLPAIKMRKSALHAVTGSNQSAINEQRIPDTEVSLFPTMKMRKSALHAATGSYQSVIDKQRIPDTEVS